MDGITDLFKQQTAGRTETWMLMSDLAETAAIKTYLLSFCYWKIQSDDGTPKQISTIRMRTTVFVHEKSAFQLAHSELKLIQHHNIKSTLIPC